jgi:hypothetical protein
MFLPSVGHPTVGKGHVGVQEAVARWYCALYCTRASIDSNEGKKEEKEQEVS